MAVTKWVRLMVFDLDCTLWPFHVDMFYYSPPYKMKDGQVVDSQGAKMEPYPEVLDVLKHWSTKCEIAVASRTSYPEGAHSLLKLFGFEKYITYKEIYPGCKQTHFLKLRKDSGIQYHDMLFFDDESRNIRDIKRIGVESVLVDESVGVTKKLVEDIIASKFDGPKI